VREYLLMALVAAAVTYLLVPLVRVFAIRIGAMPEVRDRDVHTTPTPRLGGLAMYGGLVAGLLVAAHLPHNGAALSSDLIANGRTVWAIIIAGGLIVLTGFLDDWWGMDPFIKLGGQIAAAGILVVFGLNLPWIPTVSGGSVSLDGTLTTIITILIVVVSINAVNFVDGLDGLAAGIVCIAAMATWTYSIALSSQFGDSRINVTAAIASILIGMCLGFLPHNFHPAKIFMGDTGAMLLGLLLSTSVITVTSGVDPIVIDGLNRFPVILPLLLPVAVMVLPLLDLTMAVIRRTSNGMSPFAPDRGHLHHRLLDIGHSHRRTVLIMYTWTFLFAFAVVALAIEGVPLVLFPVTVAVAVAVLVLMALPRWRRQRGAHAAGRPRPPEPPAEAATRRAPGPASRVPGATAAQPGWTTPGEPWPDIPPEPWPHSKPDAEVRPEFRPPVGPSVRPLSEAWRDAPPEVQAAWHEDPGQVAGGQRRERPASPAPGPRGPGAARPQSRDDRSRAESARPVSPRPSPAPRPHPADLSDDGASTQVFETPVPPPVGPPPRRSTR
jgi:UDP-GlcNAc:undecaprenyl-phosphate GlcNAc-1-phosphate transferase